MNYRVSAIHTRAIPLRIALCLVITVLLAACLGWNAQAQDSSISPVGIITTTEGSEGYCLSSEESRATNSAQSVNAGTLQITGDIGDIDITDSIPSYGVSSSEITITFQISDRLTGEQAHLISDDSRTVGSISLDSRIGLGALIVQTSSDGENWRTVSCETDVCADGTLNHTLYSPTVPELNVGCRYRVIFAYRTGIKTGTERRFFYESDVYDYTRYTEVYDFRLYSLQAIASTSSTQERTELGATVQVQSADGYQGTVSCDAEDPHSGWELGRFSVGADTVTTDADGTPVFLIQSGEQASLNYTLLQNIDALHGSSSLSILSDSSGYDAKLDASADSFGRGALIIRCTNADGTVDDPIVYTDFLASCASLNSEACILTLGEGDYEVALDYGMESSRMEFFGYHFMPQNSYYRTSFRFSVRYADCPLTLIEHGSEQTLDSCATTESGFYCSVNGAQYLELSVARKVWDENENNLVYTDFFSDISCGTVFLGEGLYEITAHNPVTDVSTGAVIYVGSDPILQDYAASSCSTPLSELRTAYAAAHAETTDADNPQESSTDTGTDIDAAGSITGSILPAVASTHASTAPILSTVMLIAGTLALLTGVVLSMYAVHTVKKHKAPETDQIRK